jgi:hypothetical protein
MRGHNKGRRRTRGHRIGAPIADAQQLFAAQAPGTWLPLYLHLHNLPVPYGTVPSGHPGNRAFPT